MINDKLVLADIRLSSPSKEVADGIFNGYKSLLRKSYRLKLRGFCPFIDIDSNKRAINNKKTKRLVNELYSELYNFNLTAYFNLNMPVNFQKYLIQKLYRRK